MVGSLEDMMESCKITGSTCVGTLYVLGLLTGIAGIDVL